MPSTQFLDPDTDAIVTIGGHTDTEMNDAVAEWWSQRNARIARRQYVAALTADARQALAALDDIKATNLAFLAATKPATTAAALDFLYNHMRAQAQAENTLATVSSRLIRLFGVVVPALSDLLDGGD